MLDTIHSIVIDEIVKRPPAIMQEIVSNVVERLKAEAVIPSGGIQLLEPESSGRGCGQSLEGKVNKNTHDLGE